MSANVIAVEVVGSSGRTRCASFRSGVPLWIGRDAACAIILRASEVSLRHAAVEAVKSGLVVTDASLRGTVVDGVELRGERRAFGPTATLRIGRYTIHASTVQQAPALRHPSAAAGAPPESAFRKRIRRALLEQFDMEKLERPGSAAALRGDVSAALARIVAEVRPEPCSAHERAQLVTELCDEALGLGPLEPLLADPTVTEIMVVDAGAVFVERDGLIERTSRFFTDDAALRAVIERIVTPLGRRIDDSSPLVDARLPDGSRVNAIIPPLALRGPCLTIRKFRTGVFDLDRLVRSGSMSREMADFFRGAVGNRRNILVSGGTGSGKTTLLNALSAEIPESERIVTIEDAAELRLSQPHVVPLESRPPNMEGKGACTIRDLVRNALRMRPDRLIVGECRGGEAVDMLQAMNTGHEGSMTTTHANSPREAVSRLETLCLMAGLDLPLSAIRAQVASSVHVIVQQARLSDGSRKVVSVSEVLGQDEAGHVQLAELYRFRTAPGTRGASVGEFVSTGRVPTFAHVVESSSVGNEVEP